MYAVFEDGSRQYRVIEGAAVKLDYREAEVGARIELTRVVLCKGNEDPLIGQPYVEGARILGEVIDHPSTKLYVQHFRRRKNYRRLRGHRQPYTTVRIKNILLPGQEPPADETSSPPPESPASTESTPT